MSELIDALVFLFGGLLAMTLLTVGWHILSMPPRVYEQRKHTLLVGHEEAKALHELFNRTGEDNDT